MIDNKKRKLSQVSFHPGIGETPKKKHTINIEEEQGKNNERGRVRAKTEYCSYDKEIYEIIKDIDDVTIDKSAVISKYVRLLKNISDKVLGIIETPIQENVKDNIDPIEIIREYELHLTVLTKMKTLISFFLSKRLLTTSIESFISTIDLVLFSLEKKIYRRLSIDTKRSPSVKKLPVSVKSLHDVNFSVAVFPYDKSHHSSDSHYFIGYHTFRVYFIEGSKVSLDDVEIQADIEYENCQCVNKSKLNLAANKESAIYVSYRDIVNRNCEKHPSSSIKKISMKNIHYSSSNRKKFSAPISVQPAYVVRRRSPCNQNVGNCVKTALSFFTKSQGVETPCMLFNLLYASLFSRDTRFSSVKILPYSTAMVMFSAISNNCGFSNFEELAELFCNIMFKFINLLEVNVSFRKLWTNGVISFIRESFFIKEKFKNVPNPKVMVFSPSVKMGTLSVFDFPSKTKKILGAYSWEELEKVDFFRVFDDYFQTTQRRESMIYIKRNPTTEENAKDVFNTFKYGIGVDVDSLSTIYKKTIDVARIESIEQIHNLVEDN